MTGGVRVQTTCVIDTWAILGSLWRGNDVSSPGLRDREKGRDERAMKVDGDGAVASSVVADTGGGLELELLPPAVSLIRAWHEVVNGALLTKPRPLVGFLAVVSTRAVVAVCQSEGGYVVT